MKINTKFGAISYLMVSWEAQHSHQGYPAVAYQGIQCGHRAGF
jgi:hypothetical protein